MRAPAALVLSLLALGAWTTPAGAGELRRIEAGAADRYQYRDTTSIANDLEFHQDPGEPLPLQVVDVALNTTSRPPGCAVLVAGRSLRCPDDVVRIEVFVGPGDDDVYFDKAGTGAIDRVTAAATVSGEAGNDCLEGTDQDDTIDGGAGNDIVYGSSGRDTITGGDGGDRLDGFWDPSGCTGHETPVVPDVGDDIDGGLGNDTLAGDTGDDELTDSSGRTTASGGAGADTIRTAAGFTDTIDGDADRDTIRGSFTASSRPANGDTLRGGAGPDDVAGGPANDTIDGGDSNDQLVGDLGSDTITGGAGPDTLVPGLGRDIVNGGTETDVVRYTEPVRTRAVNVSLSTGAGDDGSTEDAAGGLRDALTNVESVSGTAFADTLTADAGSNALQGNGGDDTLSAGAGNDSVQGGDGNDTMNGGLGSDTIAGGNGGGDIADYADRTAPVTVTLNTTGRDDGSVPHDGATATALDDVESTEVVRGGAAGDRLIADPTGGSRLTGNGGDDQLTGGAGADLFEGGRGADTADGRGGSDRITYAAVSEPVAVTLNDGIANDGGVADTSGARRDATIAIERVTGGAGADALTGDGGANVLEGGPGNDVLRGRRGSDQLFGGGGADRASFSERGESVLLTFDGRPNDGAPGEADLIAADIEGAEGGTGNDVLTGGIGPELLIGGNGNDRLTGLGGNDALIAGAGDDTLDARDGLADTVDCGAGADGGTADLEDTRIACETVGVPVVVLDADRDGVPAGLDCDDADPARRTGAAEIPGNAIDEDCLDGAAPFSLIGSALSVAYDVRGKTTRFTEARVREIPPGGRVILTCKAKRRKACPFSQVDLTFPAGRKTLTLVNRFKKRKLPVRTVVELRVMHPQMIGKALRFTTRSGKRPRRATLCVTPGTTTATRCR